ncbi:MAG: antibiotic biosynthesis monooxygenase family protein [Acetobacteraceae bacterium]
MFVVIFEVRPKPAWWDAYLAHAAALRPELLAMPGFIDNLRYRSRARPGWLVSLSAWADERALVRWRAHPAHHVVQADGRARVFADYRLRVAEVLTDSAPPAGHVPAPFRRDATEAGGPRAALLLDVPATAPMPALGPAVEQDRFDGIADPAQGLVLGFYADPADAPDPPAPRRRLALILRDYGMRERAEAPQFHPGPG